MRLRVATLLLFVLSGVVSAAVAGMLVVVMVLTLTGGLTGLLLSVMVAIGAVIPAIRWGGLAAILLGGLLWTAAATRPWARKSWIWAATGALAGLGLYVFPWPEPWTLRTLWFASAIDRAGLALIFALAGAAGALAFRGTMRILLVFVPDEADA